MMEKKKIEKLSNDTLYSNTARFLSELITKVYAAASNRSTRLRPRGHTPALCDSSRGEEGLPWTNCIFPIQTVPVCSRSLIAFLSFLWENHNESALFVWSPAIYPETQSAVFYSCVCVCVCVGLGVCVGRVCCCAEVVLHNRSNVS